MSGDNKKRKGGRPRGSKNKASLVRLDKAVAAVAPQIAALKAEDKLYTVGKDNLARISSIMMRFALAYSPEEKDEKGNPCMPFWKNPADEMRFLRFMGLAYDCDKARAPYESPRLTWVRVFMLVPIFGPNPDSLPSPFGQGAGVP